MKSSNYYTSSERHPYWFKGYYDNFDSDFDIIQISYNLIFNIFRNVKQ